MVSVLIFSLAVICQGVPPARAAQPDPRDRATYEVARVKAGHDPAANVQLALWCEAHGLNAERLKHLALAILADPANSTARGLMGLVTYKGQWKTPDAIRAKVKQDEALSAAMAEYAKRRSHVANTADANWKMALWCEEKGLKPEAQAHLATVLQLDPNRDAAWKRLGYRKYKNRWVTDKQLAAEKTEAEAQKAADKHYKALLSKVRRGLTDKDKARRALAQETLKALTDPRAVPSIWLVFAGGNAASQKVALQALGRINSPGSTRALALLAVFCESPEVRGEATDILQERDPRDFVGFLIGLLRDPVTYQVRPVGGPGSAGVLLVNGKKFNVQRLYDSPSMPSIPLFPGEPIGYDAYGLPVVSRFLGIGSAVQNDQAMVSGSQYFGLTPTSNMAIGQMIQQAHQNPANQNVGQNVFADWYSIRRDEHIREQVTPNNLAVTLSRTTTTPIESTMQIPIGQIMLEYQKSAISSQLQLASDIREIEGYNANVRMSNDRVLQVLTSTTGVDKGHKRAAWNAWWTDALGYSYDPPPDEPAPTVVMDIPAPYQPQPILTRTNVYQSGPSSSTVSASGGVSWGHTQQMASQTFYSRPGFECFEAGTPVLTLTGARPIETIRVGDQVLTQASETGKLSFEPVVVVYHNKPNQILKISLGAEIIGATTIHRFWKVGTGWVMARDLKVGDPIRSLRGVLKVMSISPGPIQPVFNLKVAEGASYMVGVQNILVHDDGVVQAVARPFDALPDLAEQPLKPN